MDEAYLKIKGEWKYFYRAVDKQSNTIDFLLTAKRDKKAARRFLNKAIGFNSKPSLINTDKSGASTAAIQQYNKDETSIRLLFGVEMLERQPNRQRAQNGRALYNPYRQRG